MDHREPVGRYWEKLKREVPCLRIEFMKAPGSVMGRKISLVEHKSDVARFDETFVLNISRRYRRISPCKYAINVAAV